jgi:hypothetical protein
MQIINRIAAGGPGLVAIGSEQASGLAGAAWTSRDGSAWTRTPDPAGAFNGPGSHSIEGIATGAGEFVAVGFEKLASADLNA